ncbi:VOC family protein [Leptolyngbya sp. 15MV]|nr:VOC family protein [Leptolyngbya sp. 15MV]
MRGTAMPKNTICLWYEGEAEAAARFYASIFPDSAVTAVRPAPADFPAGKKGDVLTVEFTVLGTPCVGLNGGPIFKHSEAFSFQVATNSQEETDRYCDPFPTSLSPPSAFRDALDARGLAFAASMSTRSAVSTAVPLPVPLPLNHSRIVASSPAETIDM